MGTIIQAICPCGLESEPIMQGIGFSYPENKTQMEPAYCDTCGIVVGRDLSKLFSKCPKCRKKIRFFLEEMETVDEEQSFIYPSLDYQRDKEHWHCPRCKQETLQFWSMGCWD
jgi:predicted Zn-ribbon and HTH transcriptional regulator